MDEAWVAGELRELKHAWGSAYRITGNLDRWVAVRRDGQGQVSADDPWLLLERIREDYAVSPVARNVARC